MPAECRCSVLRRRSPCPIFARAPLLAAAAAATLALAPAPRATAGVAFREAYSPQEGLTKPVQQPWRQEICLNGTWEFQPVPLPEGYDLRHGAPVLPAPQDERWSKTPLRIPSPWNVNRGSEFDLGITFPSYPREWNDAAMGWMRRSFRVPEEWRGRRVLVHFEAVFGYAQVVVNGFELAQHFQNSLPFEVDVTDVVKFGADNTLLVGVRMAKLFDVPGKYGKHTYPAGPPWPQAMGGIWQDVYLQARPVVNIDEIVVRPQLDEGVLELQVTVKNTTNQPQTFELGGRILPWINLAGSDPLSAPVPRWKLGDPVVTLRPTAGTVAGKSRSTFTLRQPIRDELERWTLATPHLYSTTLDLTQGGETRDRGYERFGWRQWGIRGRDLTLNGEPVQLLGDAAIMEGVSFLSRRYAWARYHTLKEVNGNAVRLHVLVRPRFYLELADEMGLAVLEESDLWASSIDFNYGPAETWLRFNEHIDGMVQRDRNHPSIFGWSIANEILSALWWKAVPRAHWPPVLDGVVAFADRVRALDPTRPWISSDGDGDLHGRLPAYVYHYGRPKDWIRNAPKDRPMAFGEAGSMLWGSPVVFSAYNGERSYESFEGMMDGAAREAYWYLAEQRKIAAYCSTFTFELTAFLPLPLGMSDRTKKPTLADGVFFGPLVEGVPGMQPERLAPYSTLLNPGFDPDLPMYEPTRMHDAYRAAYAPGGPAPSELDHFVRSDPLPSPPAATIGNVGFVGAADGKLAGALARAGVPIQPGTPAEQLLVVDTAGLRESDVPVIRQRAEHALHAGGTVMIWTSPETEPVTNALLRERVALVTGEATGLFADRQAPETAAIPLASLYFGDQSDRVIARAGLTGPLVDKGRVLMRANTIGNVWDFFFGGGDALKAAVLVATPSSGGRLLVTTLAPDVRDERRLGLMRAVFANLGVALGPPDETLNRGIDGAGFVRAALIAGAFHGTPYPENLDHAYLGDEAALRPREGDRAGEYVWKRYSEFAAGLMDFFRLEIAGAGKAGTPSGTARPESLDGNGYLEPSERLREPLPGINAVTYVSFWLHTPRATSAEAADLVLKVFSDDGVKVWLNRQEVYADREVHGPGGSPPAAIPLTLQPGWNHVLAKVGQLDGPWLFSAQLAAKDPALLDQLKVATTHDD